jgi:hypothetical protein
MSGESLMPPLPESGEFNEIADWLLSNYGLLVTGEKRGPGLVVPLRTRVAEATGLGAFKTKLIPYRITDKDGKTHSPLDLWLTLPERVEVAGFRTMPDKPWPTYVEDDKTYVNLYLRPQLPEDGDASMGHELLKVLVPDEGERAWYMQCLAHKLRHPEIPGPSIVMVAQDTYGVGRGTWFKILEGLFGGEYVARPSFDDVVGKGSQAVYNDWMADSILALVNETSSEEDYRYVNRRQAYERLKELIDTSRQRRWIKGKYEKLYRCLCGPGFTFASNNGTPLAIAFGDRRLTFLKNGPAQPREFYVASNTWAADPRNLGAFRRDLETVDLTGFNAYEPRQTTLRDVVMEESRSTIDEAVDLVFELLPGEIVQSVQVIETIEILRNRQKLYLHGEWEALAAREVKRGYRIGIKHGANWRPCLPERGQRMAAYARSEEARVRWTVAAYPLVLAELQKNEAKIAKLKTAKGRIIPFETVGGSYGGGESGV